MDVDAVKLPIFKAVTIDKSVLKVIQDALQIKQEKYNVKHEKQEMLPPLTTTYKQFDTIRAVHDSYRAFRYEIQECAIRKKERMEELEEVKNTCDAYKDTMLNFTTFITQNFDKRQRTFKQMDVNLRQLNKYTYDNRRYIRCAQELLYVKDVLEQLIDANTCYVTFMENVAGHSVRYSSSESVAVRYKALNETRERLTAKYNNAMIKIQGYRDNVFKEDNKGLSDLFIALQRLQKVGYELEQIKEKTALFELSISKIRSQSVEYMVSMCQILTAVEEMVNKLIYLGIAPEELRQMTLSQQFEKIKEEHFRQKAILKEYHLTKTVIQKRHTRRLRRMRKRALEKGLHDANKRKLKNLQSNFRSMISRMNATGGGISKELASLNLDQEDIALLNSKESEMDLMNVTQKKSQAVKDDSSLISSEPFYSPFESSDDSLLSSSSTDIQEIVVSKSTTPVTSDIPEGVELVPAVKKTVRKRSRKLIRHAPDGSSSSSDSESSSSGLSISSIGSVKEISRTIIPQATILKKTDVTKDASLEDKKKVSDDESLDTIDTLSVDSSLESLPSVISKISLDSQSTDDMGLSLLD